MTEILSPALIVEKKTFGEMPEEGLVVVEEIPALSIGPFRATTTGLVVDGNPTFEEWVAYGRGLKRVQKSIAFLVGDWLLYGEWTWGDRYAQALEETDFAYGTLRNDRWLASCVPPDVRNENLSLSHHREVATMSMPEQERWLGRAESEGWNAQQLRDEIKADRHRETNGECPTLQEHVVRVVVDAHVFTVVGTDAIKAAKSAFNGMRFPYFKGNVEVKNVDVLDVGAVIDG